MSSWMLDLRVAVRSLGRRPGFAAVAIVTLALGIGANTAIFGIFEAVALRPLPYPEAEELLQIRSRYPFSEEVMEQWQERARGIEALSGFRGAGLTLVGNGDPVVLEAGVVAAEHFTVMGVHPTLGRGFRGEEEQPGGEGVVVIGHALWQSRFGGDPEIIGRSIELRGDGRERRTVVGVMPPNYRPLGRNWQAWVPHSLDRDDDSYIDMINLGLIARLAPGTTLEAGQADIRRVGAELVAELPDRFSPSRLETLRGIPLRETIVSGFRPTLWILQGAVALVLMIACLNVANLLLARSASRRGEIAVRTALGAGRGRLVRMLLTEHALLGGVGAVLGLGIAWGALAVVRNNMPAVIPRVGELTIHGGVAAFALGLGLLAGLCAGLLPALRASSSDLLGALHGVARGGSSTSRWNSVLVAGEIALSLVLVASAGMMMRSLWKLHDVPLGFRAERLLTMRVMPPAASYADDDARRLYYERALEGIRALPGVESAESVSILPMTLGNMGLAYLAEGQVQEPGEWTTASYRTVSPGYFESIGIPLLRGRGFSTADRAGGLEAGIINRTMAERLWPGEDPIGKQIAWDAENPWFTVVGVVENVRQNTLDGDAFDVIYRPYSQESFLQDQALTVRSAGDPAALAPAVRAALREIDAEVPVLAMETMEQIVAGSSARRQLITGLLFVAAALALLLGAIGVYGVAAYEVSRRTREIGLRMALGASRSTVLREVLWGGARWSALGLAAGLIGAGFAARILGGLLFEVDGLDPFALGGASLTLVASALLACWIPARRASRIDPWVALRSE